MKNQMMVTYTIEAKTAKGAASATLRAIKKLPGGEYASMRPTEWGNNGWQIVWESGPYEWPVIATGPGDIFAEELGGNLTDAYMRNKKTFDFNPSGNRWFAEPQNSYSLNFWKD
jgi:hypothetical protein